MKSERFSVIVACVASAIAGASLMTVFGLKQPDTRNTPLTEDDEQRAALMRLHQSFRESARSRVGAQMPSLVGVSQGGYAIAVLPGGDAYVIAADGQANPVWSVGLMVGPTPTKFDSLKQRPLNLKYGDHPIDFLEVYPDFGQSEGGK